MYKSYDSLKEIIHKDIENQKSVLNKFPENISRPIVQSCSKHLAQFTSFQLPFKSDNNSKQQPIQLDQINTNQTSNVQSIQNTFNNINQHKSDLGSISGPTSSNTNEIGNHEKQMNIIQLDTVEQVNWTLENIMYGLTLSLEYQDTIKDCWNVYHDWLSVLLDEKKHFLPQVIKNDPINYSRKMLWHLYALFIPRKDSQLKSNELTKHIMMCHGVLMLIETIAKDSKLMKRDLWEDFLKFFLAINDAVLAPPFIKDDFGEILSSRIVATLFEIWLIACNKVFPSPALWKTFQEYCSSWRHHVSMVIEWNRVCFALTNRLLELIWWPEATSCFNKNITTNDTNVAYDIQTIINSMNTETVLQAWFRFLHIIGKPIDFSDTKLIAKNFTIKSVTTMSFYENSSIPQNTSNTLASAPVQAVSGSSNNVTIHTNNQLACVKKLPFIFLESIKGVSRLVDIFLGIYLVNNVFSSTNNHGIPPNQKITSAHQSLEQKIRSSRASMPLPNLSSLPYSGNLVQEPRLNAYHTNRPSVNSIMHLVGNWLFDASFKYSTDSSNASSKPVTEYPLSPSITSIPNREFILGQAEAYGILCKIFCSVKTGEKILPEYLSRFYSLLQLGLKIPANFGEMNSANEYESGEILASILVNGYNIFKLDLDGINILHLPMLFALNAVFKLKYVFKEEQRGETNKPKELIKSVFNIGAGSVTLVDLKNFAINIFTSLLSLSNQLNSLPVYDKDFNVIPNQSFFSMRSKILEIFLAAMTNEHDFNNLQILFGCGRLIVGEWSIDEINRRAQEIGFGNSSMGPGIEFGSNSGVGLSNSIQDKKERVSYCFNQVVSMTIAPLKINTATLQNHSFALSIFDSLISIAAGDILVDDENVFHIAISWIWHYVKNQIKRRSREHTKEMHSVIVAAYNCLISLLIKKPSLLRDKNCLQTVNNCIEIGISGTSSYPEQTLRDDSRENSVTLMKADKELKPASLRVKEAAECVLCFIMEQTSMSATLDNTGTSDLTRNTLDENSLIELTRKSGKFKYGAIYGSLIIAVFEKPLYKVDKSPTITILLRGPFTCQAWSLHLRSSSFSKMVEVQKQVKQTKNSENLNHTVFNNLGLTTLITLQEDVNDLESSEGFCSNSSNGVLHKAVPKCEMSIPTLSEVSSKWVKNLAKFQNIKEDQIKFEIAAVEKVKAENIRPVNLDREEPGLNPKSSQEFQSTRILLSHLGFCSLECFQSKPSKDDQTDFIGIDSADSNFLEQLTILDNLPTRTFSSCSIFYVKKKQSNAKAIVNNINNPQKVSSFDKNFFLFLHSLGSVVEVARHQTAKFINECSPTSPNKENHINSYPKSDFVKKLDKINGIDSILYWADISSELVFYLPNNAEIKEPIDEAFKAKNQSIPPDTKVLVIWLEQVQDADALPIDELLTETSSYENFVNPKPKEVIILFIVPLKSKMHRIMIWNSLSKRNFYTMPLVDGMLVSSRMLGSMVRQTVLNIFRRKRLEIDDYQPPHVRRKNKISEIIKKFQSKKSEADFFTSLLMH